MLTGIPDEYGATGLVHSTGWMTSDNFLRVLEHFVAHVRCSKERQVILIMDITNPIYLFLQLITANKMVLQF
ncbi:hypothetical protein PPYR_05214 [Photinus pyralis]|uniref:Uncharacterized protein n=1 Tax=Photinus pyralis TaxID=7054 RepID=A0A5N4B0I7_PHOPY|nr:hypothetical protein PPYR_05214 [Photinus pyralis]